VMEKRRKAFCAFRGTTLVGSKEPAFHLVTKVTRQNLKNLSFSSAAPG
jgi:hypothetical protein